MPSVTVENYLKQVYLEQQQVGEELVPMGRLAAAMGVTPGSATSMVKALADAKLLDYAPRGGVRLTREGTRLALQVLRRHRLIELFLVEVLKLDWSEVHDEAEELEHAISEKLLARIDEHLGHPDTDPHGDPIPPATGAPQPQTLTSLVDAVEGRPLTIARVADQDPAFLQFADRHGLTPGVGVTITARDPAADAVTVQPDGRTPVTLGLAAAAKILAQT
ncbi:MAG: metal-dependent transcriptional regulator [Phycisphaeraceae bacterium]